MVFKIILMMMPKNVGALLGIIKYQLVAPVSNTFQTPDFEIMLKVKLVMKNFIT